jgi:site-specific DNA-methyltransferase (adenine-specific)
MTDNWKVEQGDCRDIMRTLPDNSVDAIVSDPPYGLSFMGKAWDHGVPGVEFWAEALRVAKPGAHLVAFGGTRTYHRLAVAIEDAGWDVRDCLSWLYGSGFPKSLDVSKAMDKAAGVEREVIGTKRGTTADPSTGRKDMPGKATGVKQVGIDVNITAPATDAAKRWHGWGTALKPAWEPIILARKPLTGTVAANVTQYGTGAINVDGCRIGTDAVQINRWDDGAKPFGGGAGHAYTPSQSTGRWPANVLLDEDAAGMLDAQAGERGSFLKRNHDGKEGGWPGGERTVTTYGDSGGPSRFFYTAKVSRKEREAGLDGMPERISAKSNGAQAADDRGEMYDPNTVGLNRTVRTTNHHPTVKPIALMRWLCRLVTPPNGLILDPFNGSGSTGCAAVLEGFRYLGCELEAEYVEIARRRIAYWETQRAEPDLFG